MILSRQNVTMSQSGEYRCSAGNVLGETSSSIHLQINNSERTMLHHWTTVFSLILFYAMAATWAWVCIRSYERWWPPFSWRWRWLWLPCTPSWPPSCPPWPASSPLWSPRVCDIGYVIQIQLQIQLQILFLLVSRGPHEGLWVLQKVKNTCHTSQIWPNE